MPKAELRPTKVFSAIDDLSALAASTSGDNALAPSAVHASTIPSAPRPLSSSMGTGSASAVRMQPLVPATDDSLEGSTKLRQFVPCAVVAVQPFGPGSSSWCQLKTSTGSAFGAVAVPQTDDDDGPSQSADDPAEQSFMDSAVTLPHAVSVSSSMESMANSSTTANSSTMTTRAGELCAD